ncbi:MAG: GNAT family N-acetyltransferase [Candidatus Omnitrophica bacterium]|nr:GNAT family N-acetyltransferase [Candidatus Omnitrophota bacterium]
MIAESEFKTKIVRKIEEIPLQDWNKVFPKALENYYFFKNLDESNLSQFSFFYILVYDMGTCVGATSCFIMDFPLDIAIEGKLKIITNFIKRFFRKILSPKILICGSPMGQGRIGIAAEPKKVIQAIYKCMEGIARKEKVGIIAFKDFDLSYKNIFDECFDGSFLRIDSLPSTDMDINFTSFDEYLKTLSSVSRSGLKRKLKKIENQVKIDLEITNKLEEGILSEVYALYLQAYENQEIGLEKLSIDFFRNISKNMPDETKFFLWKINNKLAAFAFCLISGDYFIDYYLGFDYSIAYKYNLYFVRFRDLMNWCIENKIKKYEMGQTGYEPKRRLGFRFIPLYIYVKHRSKLFNPVFKKLSYMMRPVNFQAVSEESNDSKKNVSI